MRLTRVSSVPNSSRAKVLSKVVLVSSSELPSQLLKIRFDFA
jgi:hypothetical protein